MSRTIPYSEYRRRVFNTALLEAIKKPYLEALGENTLKGKPVDEVVSTQKMNALPIGGDALKTSRAKLATKNEDASQPDLVSNGAAEAAPSEPNGDEKKLPKDKKVLLDCDSTDLAMCETMCNSYFTEELHLETSTIGQTKARLAGANNYIVEAANEAEEIANRRAEEAKELGVEVQDDDKIELSPEDNAVLDQLFHSKGPGPQIDQIRDATVRALVEEERKSKEVRDALDLANAKGIAEGNPNAFTETANRINEVGPTSLFGSIMNNMSRAAIRDVNESGRFTNVGDVLAENADLIKTRSVMLYAIMETGNQLEITQFSNKDVERMARNIFYQK